MKEKRMDGMKSIGELGNQWVCLKRKD